MHDIPTRYCRPADNGIFGRMAFPDEADMHLMVVDVDGSDARALTDRRLGMAAVTDGQTS